MATMTVTDTGTRSFRVDMSAGMAGAPFEGPGELLVETAGPDDRPSRVLARFVVQPGNDVQIRLPRALKGTPLQAEGLTMANAVARGGRLIVSFEAPQALLDELVGGLSSLERLPTYLEEAPNMLDFSRFQLHNAELQAETA